LIIPLVEEERWLKKVRGAQPWWPPLKPALVIAPHPDDETLCAGGLIAAMRRDGVSVTVVAVTDGHAAYPDSPNLADIRRVEQENALRSLGVAQDAIVRLELPDSKVREHEEHLTQLLVPLISSNVLVIAPWSLDWHPDHEACGRAAERVCLLQGAELMSYMFWTWHGKSEDSLDGLSLMSFELDDSLQEAKRNALSCHQSQLFRDGNSPILPERLLQPARRPFEIFIAHV
jgi:LmbE family N-acetylglucosaminyl deacetylase